MDVHPIWCSLSRKRSFFSCPEAIVLFHGGWCLKKYNEHIFSAATRRVRRRNEDLFAKTPFARPGLCCSI